MNDTPDYRGIPNAHSMYDFKENDAAGVAMRNVSLSAAREPLPVTKRNANSAHAERLLRAMSTFLDEILRFQGEPTAFWFNKLYQSFSDLTHTVLHFDIRHQIGVTILLDLLTRCVFEDTLC
eukprot:gb/GECG01009020.1/.p1 GENE.gb/GECG01009020.1/~~gb/GECG01009020.1/.p1  ORF type:complete len:122 (+),score=12.58 gb/GECG01009020.1/:1-366(+)